MGVRMLVLLVLGTSPAVLEAAAGAKSLALANPIRKVVNMLESMQKKVEEEGAKEKEAFDKFMCYCKTSGSDLKASIAAAGTKIPSLGSDIKESEASLAQTKVELKEAQSDRSEAKAAIAEATGIREKEATAFSAEKATYDANINAVTRAVGALERGMVGAFVQTPDAHALLKLVQEKKDMMEEDRQDLVAFLSGSQSYTPSGGEVTGILKSMGDDMKAALKDATATEEGAIKSFEELKSAKTKEVEALTAAIESKTQRIGELSISIVQMKNDLSDTEESLIADKDFLVEMESSCKTKTSEWEERVKTRGEELVALAETIKILNDDDALELFKKTLPGTASSLVQVETSKAALRVKALAQIHAVMQKEEKAGRPGRARLDLIALALHGKKVDFAKVIAMIDEMVGTLKAEQTADDDKKEYCATQFDFAEDQKKALERKISDEETAIANAEEGIAKLKEEIAALEDGLKELAKTMAEATELRKTESAEFTELMASDSAAKELLLFAQNRLNKFYNPKLYKPPPKRVLSDEDTIVTSFGGTLAPTAPPGGIAGTGISFVEISSHKQHKAAPPPPPETFGAYTKKSEENSGVVAMMDLLIKDLDKEMTEAKTMEADAQKDYEKVMKDSATKQVTDSKLLTLKKATKADLEEDLEAHGESMANAKKKLMATEMFISSLHSECDWLLKYFDVRKEARASEVDALGKAKAVLSGADFSLLQTKARGFLRK